MNMNTHQTRTFGKIKLVQIIGKLHTFLHPTVHLTIFWTRALHVSKHSVFNTVEAVVLLIHSNNKITVFVFIHKTKNAKIASKNLYCFVLVILSNFQQWKKIYVPVWYSWYCIARI